MTSPCNDDADIHSYILLLNIVKSQIFHPVYNFKNLNLAQPASQHACHKTGSTSAAPDFSHKKGNCV